MRHLPPGQVATRTVALLALLATGSCHCCAGPCIVSPAPFLSVSIRAIEVAPQILSLAPGGTTMLVASGILGDGTSVRVNVEWTATGGSITPEGIYTAGSTLGHFRAVARLAGSTLTDTAKVTIQSAPKLVAVKVTPETGTLAPGVAQDFSAVGLMDDATTALVSVTWAATGGTVSATGLYTAGATAGAYRVIATETGGTLADTAAITVTPPGPTTLVVQPAGIPAAENKWLLLDTDTGIAAMASCPSDRVTHFALAEQPIEDVWPGCTTELSLFARGYSAVLDVAPTKSGPGPKLIIHESMSLPLTMKVRVIYEYQDGGKDAESDLSFANDRFRLNAMGLVLGLVGTPDSISPDKPAGGSIDPLATAIAQGCSGVAEVPELVQSDRLNVLMVREDQWPSIWVDDDYYGYNCFLEGHRNVIFIRENHADGTLAHEVGHALSLLHVGYGFDLSDYDYADGNVMQDSAFNPGSAQLLDHFTLGQSYRANFSADSWVYKGGLRTGTPKSCPALVQPGNQPENWPCPQLSLDWP